MGGLQGQELVEDPIVLRIVELGAGLHIIQVGMSPKLVTQPLQAFSDIRIR
jgi:hypothetical protein